MSTKSSILNPAGRLLARGERGVAFLGLVMAGIFVGSFAIDSVLNDHANRQAAAEKSLSDLKVAGPLLAETSQRLLADGDLVALRRLASTTAAGLKLGGFTISIGSGRVLADMLPARVNMTALPDRWTADPIDTSFDTDGTFRFPFNVPNRGAGLVELVASSAEPLSSLKNGHSALICAIGLCVLVLVYRRSRAGLAETEVVRGALAAMHGGETATAALLVDTRLGTAATAWNNLMVEIDELRLRAKSATAAPAQANRRAAGNTLEAACEAMSQGLILIDDKMRVRFANGAAGALLKKEGSTLDGMAGADLVDDTKFREAMHSIAAGKLRRPVVVELEQTHDHEAGVLRFCIRPVRRGDSDSAMIIIEDITQQRMAERARNQFVSQVTHELRTPLTNIRLYTETAIEDGESNPEVRANCLNVINQESRRLERIVSEMLSVAEIEAGSTMIRRDEVYFDVLVKDLENDYKAQAEEKAITLEFNVSPKLPKLEADKDKLAIACHNLIGNALKYTPAGGKVTVGVDVRDGQLAIDVADSGIGIEPAEQDKIFDRFFRSGDPRVGKIVGTGLGLTLAREVMRLHGGDITVQSVINRGSTFTATMPVAAAA